MPLQYIAYLSGIMRDGSNQSVVTAVMVANEHRHCHLHLWGRGDDEVVIPVDGVTPYPCRRYRLLRHGSVRSMIVGAIMASGEYRGC